MPKDIMIIVPHQDDEVLVYSGMIMREKHIGNHVKVAYMTNGNMGAEIIEPRLPKKRMQESITALSILGVSNEDILFMGYGDLTTLDNAFNSKDNPNKIFPSGNNMEYTETFGYPDIGCVDFRYAQSGYHSPYTREAIIKDLSDLIALYKPSDIYTTSEYETHPDHRATFRFLNEVIIKKREKGDYCPILHFSIIHSSHYSIWPQQSGTNFTDPFFYRPIKPVNWDKRKTVKLDADMKQRKAQAVAEYISQLSYLSALMESFIKDDEFYFTIDYSDDSFFNQVSDKTIVQNGDIMKTNNIEERKIMLNELKIIDDIEILYKNEVVIYGAGNEGVRINRILRNLGVNTVYFCDGNPSVWGNYTDGIEIISPKRLKELDSKNEVAVIISTIIHKFQEQILSTLDALNMKTDKIFTSFSLEISISQNINKIDIDKDFYSAFLQTCKIQKRLSNDEFNRVHMKEMADCLSKDYDVIVCYPSKVGSMSVYSSLLTAGIPSRHVGFLTNYYLNIEEINGFSEAFKRLIKEREKVKVISLFREPISRDYSSLFHELGNLGYNYIMEPGNNFLDSCTKWMTDLATNHGKYKYGYQFDWFDNELYSTFGVDVFAHPFDREKGYSIVKQKNVEILIIKLEKLNSLESIISEFVGAPHFKLINTNIGEQKTYSYLYKNLRDVIKLPREIVSLYYNNNQHMDHFYSEEEKEKFLVKWKGNIVNE